jgi:hypothetical protein
MEKELSIEKEVLAQIVDGLYAGNVNRPLGIKTKTLD